MRRKGKIYLTKSMPLNAILAEFISFSFQQICCKIQIIKSITDHLFKVGNIRLWYTSKDVH